MIGWEVRILADNEQQDDYLCNMLNALNEKEQESQSNNDTKKYPLLPYPTNAGNGGIKTIDLFSPDDLT